MGRKRGIAAKKIAHKLNCLLPNGWVTVFDLAIVLWESEGGSVYRENYDEVFEFPTAKSKTIYMNKARSIMYSLMDNSGTIYKSEKVGRELMFTLNEKGRKMFPQVDMLDPNIGFPKF